MPLNYSGGVSVDYVEICSVCAALLSAIFLLVQYFLSRRQRGHAVVGLFESPRAVILKTTRLIGCIALFVLTSISGYRQILLSLALLYATVLAVASLPTSIHWSAKLSHHLTTVLVIPLLVYFVQDVYPLGISNGHLRHEDDHFLFIKIAILSITAVVIPALTPRLHALDIDEMGQKEQVPVAEEMASPFSRITYAYMDHIIWKAWQKEALTVSDLPQLASANKIRRLFLKASPYTDPFGSRRRKLRLGLLIVFSPQIAIMICLQLLNVALSFVSPLAIKLLLAYLESGYSHYRRWFIILFLFIGPIVNSVVDQYFTFIGAQTKLRLEAILTELVLNHSLRLSITGSTDKSGKAKQDFNGRINNLIASDISNVCFVADVVFNFLSFPILVAVTIWFLYDILQWSALVGLAVMLVCLPIPGYLMGKIQGTEKARMKATDSRVQSVAETLGILRMVKIMGWEDYMQKRTATTRTNEVKLIRKTKMLFLITVNVNFVIPLITMISTYAAYTLLMKERLDVSKIFSSIAVFEILRIRLRQAVTLVRPILKAILSLGRLEHFLDSSNLLDKFNPDFRNPSETSISYQGCSIKSARFEWSQDSERQFTLTVEGRIDFKSGLTVVTGPTGSGKTSLLLSLLGEMHYTPLSGDSWTHLPRLGGVAYVAQDSWVLNQTIRDNIVFDSPFNEDRYDKVLSQCALNQDLQLFAAGDLTEVGERGMTLSGGQKARLTLARAVYSTAEILLLDDIFAALDVHTGKHIAEKCIEGDLLSGRKVVLVTHHVPLVAHYAQQIVLVGSDGKAEATLMSAATISSIEAVEGGKSMEIADNVEPTETKKTAERPSGQLVTEEKVKEGVIESRAYSLYMSNASSHPYLTWILFFGLVIVGQLVKVSQPWWLGRWAAAYEGNNPVKVPFFLGVYGALVVLAVVISTGYWVVFIFASARASERIHDFLMDSVLGATLRWLDVTPTSRITQRATQDIQIVDDQFSFGLRLLSETTADMAVKLVAIFVFTGYEYILPALVISALGVGCGKLYMRAQLSVRREMSKARAPLMAHLQSTINGLVSIRAYGAEEKFMQESMKKIDHYTRITVNWYNLARWVSIRSEFLGAVFVAGLAVYLVYGKKTVDASDTGFSLTMAMSFGASIFMWVRLLNGFELSANSLERILQYLHIPHEPRLPASTLPAAHWPTSGRLNVQGLRAKYDESEEAPEVLHGLDFELGDGERVAVVGRTGSGKSTLALALLRLIPTSGEVLYDDVLTSTVDLRKLRSNMCVVPQMPELLSGTVRQNLDPLENGGVSDKEMNDALRDAGLFSASEPAPGEVGAETDVSQGRKIGLDTEVSAGGGNLSVGQRQMVVIARAMLRKCRLFVLDEATSAIDAKSDAIIQSSLRRESTGTGRATLLTIAHRLSSIMDYDRIMVMDAGRIAEFGPPRELLEKGEGYLRRLVDESRDREQILRMVQ